MGGYLMANPTRNQARSRHCHPERRRGIWPRIEGVQGLWPDASTALRSAQHDNKGQGRARRDKNPGHRRSGADRRHAPVIDYPSSIINPPAFTLIELLVVISVIALLMALAFPAFQGARKHARAVVCQSRLHQAGLILAVYVQENNGLFPEYYGDSNPARVSSRPPFDKDPKLALCPSAVRPRPGERVPWGGPTWPYAVEMSERTSEGQWPADSLVRYASYGLNRWTASSRSRRGIPFDLKTGPWGTADVKGTANVPVAMDCTWNAVHPYDYDEPPPYEGHIVDHQMSMVCIDRHSGGINVLWMDWSIRKAGLKEMWTLKWSRHFETAGPWTKAGGVQPEDWPEWMRKFKEY